MDNTIPILLTLLLVILIGYFVGYKQGMNTFARRSFYRRREREEREKKDSEKTTNSPSPSSTENFTSEADDAGFCQDRCPEPDPSKWVLKATVPPCPPMPDMSRYMLKTECPPQPDMSKYILKSSVPSCPPCISTCSKPCKIGECPPCPRPRCPTVKCPEPKACPACPAVSCPPCDEPRIQCKAQYESSNTVRPMLASTKTFGF